MDAGEKGTESYIYIVKPYKEQLFRIQNPFPNTKDVKLFVNSDILVIA